MYVQMFSMSDTVCTTLSDRCCGKAGAGFDIPIVESVDVQRRRTVPRLEDTEQVYVSRFGVAIISETDFLSGKRSCLLGDSCFCQLECPSIAVTSLSHS